MAASVRKAVATAASLVAREDLAARAESGASDDADIALLVRCFNLAESELGLDYFPLETSETLKPEDGAILFASFSKTPIQIVSVRSVSGMGTPFSVKEDRICLERAEEAVVTYTYAPTEKTLDGSSEVRFASVRLLALGTAAQYLLAQGRYEESAAFEQRFRDAVRAAFVTRHKLAIRARRWA